MSGHWGQGSRNLDLAAPRTRLLPFSSDAAAALFELSRTEVFGVFAFALQAVTSV
jgi:hypothetical protein